MTDPTEREKCIEMLAVFSKRLDKARRQGRSIFLDWQACGVLWSYLSPAVDMLKADKAQSVSPGETTEERHEN